MQENNRGASVLTLAAPTAYDNAMAKKLDDKEMKHRSIKATDADWARWKKLAKGREQSLSALIRTELRRAEQQEQGK